MKDLARYWVQPYMYVFMSYTDIHLRVYHALLTLRSNIGRLWIIGSITQDGNLFKRLNRELISVKFCTLCHAYILYAIK